MKCPYSCSPEKCHLPFSLSRARKASLRTASLAWPIGIMLWHPCFPVLPHEHSPNLPSDLGTSGQFPIPQHSQNTCSTYPEKQLQDLLLVSFAALLLNVGMEPRSLLLKATIFINQNANTTLHQSYFHLQPRPWQGLHFDRGRQITPNPEQKNSRVRLIQNIWKSCTSTEVIFSLQIKSYI